MFKKIYNFLKRIYDFLFNNTVLPSSKMIVSRVPEYFNEIIEKTKDRALYTINKIYIKRRPRSLRPGLRSKKYYQKILLRKRKPTKFSKKMEYVRIPKRHR